LVGGAGAARDLGRGRPSRRPIPRLRFLDGYELFANLLLAALGGVMLLLSDADEPA
jgi:hypothetical protein